MSSNSPATLKIKAQLQYDYSAQIPGNWALGAIGANVRDELSLQVYFIQGIAVMTLKQCDVCSPNAAPTWIVGDTAFPATPVALHTLALTPLQVEVVTVVSDADEVWFLRTDDPQHPNWRNFSKPSLENPDNYRMVDAIPFLDADGTLFVAALITEKRPAGSEPVTNIYLLNPKDGSWIIDQAIDLSDFVIKEFIPHAIFGSASNNSKYGFLVCGDDVADDSPGIAILTGGTSVLKTTTVAKGGYDSVCYVQFPFLNTPPLIFALDASTRKAAYFSRVEDSTTEYTKTDLFENVSLRQIQATLRINSDDKPYKIEIYAVTEANQILHIVSEAFDESTIRADGKLTYPKLRRFVIIANNTQSMFLASSNGGFAALMVVKTDATLVKMVQDEDATSWSSEVINEPSLENIQKQRVYYIEVVVEDSNRVPATGLLIAVGSIHYANIVVNGYAVAVNPNKRYHASTNGLGKISITILADTLAAPTLTLWMEGMASKQEIDILATIGIQKKFKTITAQELRDATNQETGNKILSEKISDDRVQKLATSLQTLMSFTDTTPSDSADSASTTSNSITEAPTSMLVYSDVALMRSKDQPSLGCVRPGPNAGRSLVGARRKLVELQASTDAEDQTLDVPWGDIFVAIKENAYSLADVLVNKVTEGVQVVLKLAADGINYIWSGIVQFVQQAFDAVGALFARVDCAFQDLFGWLCYLLDWNDIKSTAMIFKGYIANFKTNCTYWIDNVLPLATNEFLQKCEDKLTDAFDSAKSKVGEEKIGKYDETDEPSDSESDCSNTTDANSDADAQTAFDNLPSTAMWLQAKFLDGGADSGDLNFTRSLTTLEGYFTTLRNSLTTFYSDDFKSAANQFMDLLLSFVSRSTIDDTKIVALLGAVGSALKTILKTISSVINTLTDIGKEVLNFLDEILQAHMWPSALGSIFKSIFDVDLTLENAICYLIAIPFTIMHKILTGYSPSGTTTSARSIRAAGGKTILRSPILWRSILAFIHTGPDAMLDLMGMGTALADLQVETRWTKVAAIPKQLANAFGLIVPILDWQLMDPPTMWQGTARQKVAISIPAAVLICSVTWFVQTKFMRGPRGDLMGQLFLSTAGMLGLGTAVWYVFDVESVNIALALAQFLRPLSLSVKIVRQFVQRTKNPKAVALAGATMVLVDSVSGLGAGSAWFVAYKQEA